FLSLTILLIFSNVVFFNMNEVLKKSVSENYYDYYPLYQEVKSDYSDEEKSIYKGIDLYNFLSVNLNVYPTKQAQLNTNFSSVPVIQPTIIIYESIETLIEKYPNLNLNDRI